MQEFYHKGKSSYYKNQDANNKSYLSGIMLSILQISLIFTKLKEADPLSSTDIHEKITAEREVACILYQVHGEAHCWWL